MASTGGIQLGGLVSGMDTQTIITQLIAIDQRPLTLLQNEEAERTQKITEYQEINTRIKALTDAIALLSNKNLFLGKTGTVDDPAQASVTVTDDAVAGDHTLLVKELATATTLKSAQFAGKKIDPAAALKDAGLTIAPSTSGTFTINGKKISWTDTMSLNDIIGAINATSGINATAAYDAENDVFTLKSTNSSPVSMGSSTDSGNFFLAMRLNRSGQAADASGQYTVKSGPHLGALVTTEKISSSASRMSGPVTSGSFKVNGKMISVSADDKLQDVLDRINWSDAGVTAAYDAKTDRVTLTSKKQGTEFITLTDDTSGFLAATQLDGGEYAMGKQANIVLDGVEMWKESNTISDLIDGVTLTLKAPSDTATIFSITQDPSKAKAALGKFITAFNAVMSTMDKYSGAPSYDGTTQTKAAGDLFGDSTLQSVRYQLKQAVYQKLNGDFKIKSLMAIGLQMGDGTLNDMETLSLNSDKFDQALADDPEAVSKLFTDPRGFGSILSRASQSQGGDFSGALKYTIDYENNRIASLQERQASMSASIEKKRMYYVNMFSEMEQALAKIQTMGTTLANQLSIMMNTGNSDDS